jgi:hypothetical protein
LLVFLFLTKETGGCEGKSSFPYILKDSDKLVRNPVRLFRTRGVVK